MEEYYLVCTNCNGYYKLEEWELPEDFDYCQCGGELVLVEDLEDYFSYYDGDNTKKGFLHFKKSTFLLISLILLVPMFFLFLNNGIFYSADIAENHNMNIIGSDNRGYVSKDVYGSVNSSKTIAIVTGIHPRETLSKNVTSNLIGNYKLDSNSKIIHYAIKVTNKPNDFTEGRNSGEGIAADYILPDILKSDADLVIICHDHRKGYGDGFFIATPEMDEKSVKLGDKVQNSIPGFRYFKSNPSKTYSTSALKFSKPLANAGYPTFVYEIPEWVSYNEAYGTTQTFIVKCFSFI